LFRRLLVKVKREEKVEFINKRIVKNAQKLFLTIISKNQKVEITENNTEK